MVKPTERLSEWLCPRSKKESKKSQTYLTIVEEVWLLFLSLVLVVCFIQFSKWWSRCFAPLFRIDMRLVSLLFIYIGETLQKEIVRLLTFFSMQQCNKKEEVGRSDAWSFLLAFHDRSGPYVLRFSLVSSWRGIAFEEISNQWHPYKSKVCTVFSTWLSLSISQKAFYTVILISGPIQEFDSYGQP